MRLVDREFFLSAFAFGLRYFDKAINIMFLQHSPEGNFEVVASCVTLLYPDLSGLTNKKASVDCALFCCKAYRRR